jgi:hypothetical protein
MIELDRINKLLGELEQAPSEKTNLLTEHLEAARFYLTGAMPKELAFEMRLAKESLDSVADPALKSEIQEFIDAHI